MPHIVILTLFPEALEPYTRASILGIAQDRGLVRISLIDFRDFAKNRHRTVDDRPYGGGPGMVLKPEPVVECVEWLEERQGPFRKFLLNPAGRVFSQSLARQLATEERLLLVSGRYEGFDERIRSELSMEELSLGDFVLAGGEIAALAIAEAVARLVPGVLGHEQSAELESFQSGNGLDYPTYTRPRVFRGRSVPEVLLSGHHGAIASWRREVARSRTLERRPDLTREAETAAAADRGGQELTHGCHPAR